MRARSARVIRVLSYGGEALLKAQWEGRPRGLGLVQTGAATVDVRL